jgi:hypothetical protein
MTDNVPGEIQRFVGEFTSLPLRYYIKAPRRRAAGEKRRADKLPQELAEVRRELASLREQLGQTES